MKDNYSKDYLGSKYSEQLFPQAKTTNSNLDNESLKENKQKTEVNKNNFWKNLKTNDSFNKQYSLDDNKENKTNSNNTNNKSKVKYNDLTKSNLVSLFERIKYKNIIRKRRNLTNLSPDEIETLRDIRINMYKLWGKSTLGFYTFSTIVLYTRRSFLTNFYIFSTAIIGLLWGFGLGNLLNIKQSVIMIDKLDKGFTLSRNVKQSIFHKRKDLSPEEKAEIYSIQNQYNDKIGFNTKI